MKREDDWRGMKKIYLTFGQKDFALEITVW